MPYLPKMNSGHVDLMFRTAFSGPVGTSTPQLPDGMPSRDSAIAVPLDARKNNHPICCLRLAGRKVFPAAFLRTIGDSLCQHVLTGRDDSLSLPGANFLPLVSTQVAARSQLQLRRLLSLFRSLIRFKF